MNLPLFRVMFRSQVKMISGFAIGSFLYVLLIVWVYPTLSTDGLNEMMKAMPENLVKAFGMDLGSQELSGFLAGKYYGFLYLIILLIYSILTPTQLITRLIDRGSMVYLLTQAISRTKVVITQAVVSLMGLFIICLFTTLGGVLGDLWLLDSSSLEYKEFFQLNGIGFLFFAVISGYSFLIASALNDEKKSLSMVAALSMVFCAMDLIGKLSDQLDWMRSLSVFSVFDPNDIVTGEVNIAGLGIGLSIVGFVLYLLGVWIFKKRDLPI